MINNSFWNLKLLPLNRWRCFAPLSQEKTAATSSGERVSRFHRAGNATPCVTGIQFSCLRETGSFFTCQKLELIRTRGAKVLPQSHVHAEKNELRGRSYRLTPCLAIRGKDLIMQIYFNCLATCSTVSPVYEKRTIFVGTVFFSSRWFGSA